MPLAIIHQTFASRIGSRAGQPIVTRHIFQIAGKSQKAAEIAPLIPVHCQPQIVEADDPRPSRRPEIGGENAAAAVEACESENHSPARLEWVRDHDGGTCASIFPGPPAKTVLKIFVEKGSREGHVKRNQCATAN